MRRRYLVHASLIALFAAPELDPRMAAAADVTSCGQTVGAGDTGVLQTDLTCPADTHGVILGVGSAVNLNGHTISGGENGVQCDGNYGPCFVEGPGTLSEAAYNGVDGNSGVSKVSIRNVLISDTGSVAVSVDGHTKVKLTDVAIERANVDSGTTAVAAFSIKVQNVTASENPGIVLSAQRIKGKGIAFDGNGRGLEGWDVRLKTVSITDSDGVAIKSAGKLKLGAATLANNDLSGAGIDLLSASKPRLDESSTCSRSEVCAVSGPDCVAQGTDWDVCTND